MRSWSLAPLISTCFMAEPIWLHEWLFSSGTLDLPQVTSYDYGALLNEQGNPTEKYYAIQKMMATYYPEYPQQEPLIKECLPEQTLQLAAKTSLLGIWIIWLKSRPAFIPKRWKS